MTFQLLAGFAGHGTPPAAPAQKPSPKPKVAKQPKVTHSSEGNNQSRTDSGIARDVGLTVRIEVNLPPAGDQETYDRIFRSIRENLLNAK